VWVESARFGKVEVEDNSVITFPRGVLGFEDKRRFVMMRCEQTEPIQWLQCVEDPHVSMPVINPFLLQEDYHIEVDSAELEVIETCDEEDIVVACIMVLPEELQNMTVNLMAPVLINIKKMLGSQVLMDHADMPIQFPAYEYLLAYYEREGKVNAGADEKTE
jgi:flagellar assembly factor FliW